MSEGTSHLDNHPLVRAMENEFTTKPETLAAKEDWEKIVDMTRQNLKRAHSEGAMIMHEYNTTGRPYALFLRSFEIESYNYLTPEKQGELRQIITTLHGPSEVEKKLVGALSGRIPLIGIANPSDISGRTLIPRIELPNDGWQKVVRNLIDYAHFIVMDCHTLAPGVMWELETLQKANRQDTTIIVLPQLDNLDKDQGALRDIVQSAKGVIVEHETPSPDHPQLAAFQRKAFEDQINFDSLENSPLFGDLLASAAEKADKAPKFDAKNHATWLNNEGVKLFDQKKFSEALNLYSEALLIRRHIKDEPGILTTWMNIGIVFVDAGQPQDAMPYFKGALELAKKLNQAADEGLVMSFIGVAQRQLGKDEDAIIWLFNAYRLQRKQSPPADVENTLTQLADIFRDQKNGDRMIDCYTELRAYFRERKDQAGELRSNLFLGGVYYEGGLLSQAATIFEECVRLSKISGDRERKKVSVAMLEKIRELENNEQRQ